jgi:RNA polymerase sigma-70 factor (ECF subfamily)
MNIYEIYEKYQKDFMFFAFSLCRQTEGAEDLVQQAYLKALENNGLLDQLHAMQVKGWFYTTIKRQFIDTYRKQKKIVFIDEYFEVADDSVLEDHLLSMDLLKVLPEGLREMVKLRYLQGYNSQEIGKLLAINPSTVRSKLKKAVALMKTNYLR